MPIYHTFCKRCGKAIMTNAPFAISCRTCDVLYDDTMDHVQRTPTDLASFRQTSAEIEMRHYRKMYRLAKWFAVVSMVGNAILVYVVLKR